VVALAEWRGRRRRENWRRRRSASLGFGGLWVVRLAAGAAEAVGEKPLERVCPLIENKCAQKLTG